MKMTPRERAELLEQRLIDFAVRVVKMLPNSCGGQHFSRQIVRSGSAPALLYAEARGSESQKDFKHKCGIALKELREPFVNLRIIEKLEYAEPDELTPLIVENNELISIFVATTRTLKSKQEGKG
jgi:four helix bundle protein